MEHLSISPQDEDLCVTMRETYFICPTVKYVIEHVDVSADYQLVFML